MVAKMKKKTNEIGFFGVVEPSNCECHPGMFIAAAFLLHPIQGRIYLGNKAFATEAQANAELDQFVKAVAFDTLREMGLEPDKAKSITIARDDEADQHLKRMSRGIDPNPTLH